MNLGVGLLLVLGLMIYLGYRQHQKESLSDEELRTAETVREVRASDEDAGWDYRGPAAETNGLKVRFRDDADHRAVVLLLHPRWRDRELPRRRADRDKQIWLADEFETHYMHWEGWAVRIRLRGRGPLTKRRVELRLDFAGGRFVGAGLEPEDNYPVNTDVWIEVERVELLRIPGRGPG